MKQQLLGYAACEQDGELQAKEHNDVLDMDVCTDIKDSCPYRSARVYSYKVRECIAQMTIDEILKS